MKLTRLRLRDLRRHADLVVEPAPGLTVIRGPNEAGKTTIQRAVELALYRRVTSADAEMRDIQRWGTREQDAPIVELDFETNGTKGHLVKAFRGAKGTVELTIGDEHTTDPAAVDARLAELTGIPNEKFFRSTASVRHHEVMELERDEANLRDRLQQSISGAGHGVSIARRRLDDAIKAMKASGPKNPGPLKRTEDERARLSEALQRGEEALARLERDRAEHVKAIARRQAADAAHGETREQFQQAEVAVGLANDRVQAEQRYERLRDAADLRAQVATLEQGHPSAVPLDELRRRVEELRTVEGTIAQCQAVLEAEGGVLEQPLPEPRWRRLYYIGILLVFAALVVIGGQAWARLLSILPGFAGAGIVTALGSLLAVVGALSVLIAYRRRATLETVLGSNQLHHAAIERRMRGRSDTEHKLLQAQARREQLLGGIGRETAVEAEALLSAEDEHVRRLQLLEARYSELMKGETVTDVARARDSAAAEVELKKAALLGMGELGSDPQGSRARIEARLRTQQLERETAMREEAATGERVEQNEVDAVDVATASEALAQATERLALLQRRQRVYELTLSALESAEAATMKKATAFLEQRMATDVGHITAGRYDRVQVLDELQINLWSPERGDWVPVAALSQGTIDQVYLAARIELVRLVTQDRQPPLVFDDPFVTYDDDRATRALEMLRGVATDHQILYLTTSDRYDAVADKVIVLPPPDEKPTKR
jgi:hypothetical protein